jgi:hypothetical protein
MLGGPCDGAYIHMAEPLSHFIVPVTVEPPENLRGPGDELGRPFQARALYVLATLTATGYQAYKFDSIRT